MPICNPSVRVSPEPRLTFAGTQVRSMMTRTSCIFHNFTVSLGGNERANSAMNGLMATLGVTPGSVSPFGLLHEGSKDVRVIVDQDLRAADKLIFHPNLNTASVTISVADFERFLATRPNAVRWLKL